MVNFMMAVNRYCADCMKGGEFLPLHFVMVNIHSGMWMCPKTECVFPMNSHLMKDYIEDDMTTDKVLQLSKLGRRRKTKGGMKNKREITKDSLINLQNSSSSRNVTSDESSHSTRTIASKYSDTTVDDDVSTISSYTSKKTIYYPLWENTNLLCWLDAALAILVLNTSLPELLSDDSNCMVGHLFTQYKKILISYNTFFDYNEVQQHMENIRTNMFEFLQPKLLTNYGDEDSPLFCLPLVLRTSKKLCEALEISYKCIFKCDNCGFERTDGFKKIVMSVPNTSIDLDFNNNIYFSRGCYKCFTDHQKTRYQIEKYPAVMFVHFPQGVQSKRCWDDFNFVTPDGEQYIVTQIVHYFNKKRHFISWSYSYEEKLWLEADDLKDPVVHYKYKRPRCRPHEVHFVIWERLAFLVDANKLNFDFSNSCKGGSPSVSLVTSQATPDELLSDEFRTCSRESSTHSSLSSSDNVYGGHMRGSQSSSPNPFRSVENIVQKGLRNTPRYEPYVSRSCRKERERSELSEAGNTSKKETNCNSEIVKCEVEKNNVAKKTKNVALDPGNNNFIDFLKGVLSDELNEINVDLPACTGSEVTTTPPLQNTLPEAYASTGQTLDEIYDLFGD